jgi:LacI family transcriptional regulator
MGPQNIRLARERTQGFLDRLGEGGVIVPEHRRFEGDFDFQTGVEAAQQLLQQDSLPTAIWAQCDPIGAGLIREFHAAGVRIPDDVSIVGMDDTAIALMVYPRLTTVHQPLDEICRRAFGLIRTQIEADHDPVVSHEPVHLLIEPHLIVRESYRDLTE